MSLGRGDVLFAVDPASLFVQLHGAQVAVQDHAGGVVIEPDAHEVVLGIPQVGQGVEQVRGRRVAELLRLLAGSRRRLGLRQVLPRQVHAANRDGHGTTLDFQVRLQLFEIADEVPHALVDPVDELDELPPILAVVDQRLPVVVAFQQSREGRVDLQRGTQRTGRAAELDRIRRRSWSCRHRSRPSRPTAARWRCRRSIATSRPTRPGCS